MNKLFKPDVRFNKLAMSIRLISESSKNESEYNMMAKIKSTLNLEELGAGCFARVYVCPWDKSKAIKISTRLDDGWLAYAALCIKYADMGNPLLPKIFHMRIYSKIYIALIERYTDVVYNYNPRNKEMCAKLAAINAGILQRWGVEEEQDMTYRQYAQAFQTLLYKEGVRANDLHTENIMYHYKQKRIVITDPASGRYSDSRDKLKSLGVRVAA